MDHSPAVAGRFYSDDPPTLQRDVAKCCAVSSEGHAEHAIGIVSPHAGYVYSGPTAGKVYSRVLVPRRCIILGPNHTGLGAPVSVVESGRYMMPGEPIPIDEDLAKQVCAQVPTAVFDRRAHLHEHSIEVQLPFLRYFQSDLRFVPVVLARLSLDQCRSIGTALGELLRAQPEEDPVLIVASSDMSHFISAEAANRLDRLALDRIVALDPAGLYQVVHREEISMCGVIPTTIMLFAALTSGATRATLIDYTNSGETSGDFQRVVGYAGLTIQ